jgi:toxin ParE1/3/4
LLILTNQAVSDLVDISAYTFEAWGAHQQTIYLQTLETAFDRLAELPNIGSRADYIRNGYLKYLAGKHLIFYRFLSDKDIEVVRILHQSMDVDLHLP